MTERLNIPGELGSMNEVANVPFFRQRTFTWCGFADMSMLLHHRGYPLTQEEIFSISYPNINLKNTKPADITNLAGPTFSQFATRAREIVNKEIYQVGLFYEGIDKDIKSGTYIKEGTYKRFEKRGITPDDLLTKLILNDIPVMIRAIQHNVVVVGVGKNYQGKKIYRVHDSLSTEPEVWSKSHMEALWENDDELQFMNRNGKQEPVNGVLPIMSSKHLMLAIYPTRKKA